jgi:hypothetical protein
MKRITKFIYFGFASLALACSTVSQTARAVVPAPNGGYPGGNTAEGTNALFSRYYWCLGHGHRRSSALSHHHRYRPTQCLVIRPCLITSAAEATQRWGLTPFSRMSPAASTSPLDTEPLRTTQGALTRGWVSKRSLAT